MRRYQEPIAAYMWRFTRTALGGDWQRSAERWERKLRRGWLRPLLYLIIFAAGAVVGIGVTLLVIRNSALYAVHDPDEMPTRIATRMATVLSLSDDQRAEVERILRERQDALQDIRREYQPQVEEELDRLEEQVSEVLNKEQRERWEHGYYRLRRAWVPALPPED